MLGPFSHEPPKRKVPRGGCALQVADCTPSDRAGRWEFCYLVVVLAAEPKHASLGSVLVGVCALKDAQLWAKLHQGRVPFGPDGFRFKVWYDGHMSG